MHMSSIVLQIYNYTKTVSFPNEASGDLAVKEENQMRVHPRPHSIKINFQIIESSTIVLFRSQKNVQSISILWVFIHS